MQPTDPVDLYDLIRGRYERGSMVVTSNRDTDELMGMFPDCTRAWAMRQRPRSAATFNAVSVSVTPRAA